MANVSYITANGVTYDIVDADAQESLTDIETNITNLTSRVDNTNSITITYNSSTETLVFTVSSV